MSERTVPSNYYRFDYKGLRIDPYRICLIYDITHPALQHALKKILIPGNRGSKDRLQDIDEAIASLNRFKEMVVEDE